MYKTVFDLDGVMRNLMSYLHKKYKIPLHPDTYWWTYKNKDIYDWAKYDNYGICRNSPVTKYYKTIKKYFPEPEIWTHQPKDWQKPTSIWLDRHFDSYIVRFLNGEQKRKRLDKYKDILLVEDSPNFTHYNRIILIDDLLNKHIKNVPRVKNVKELKQIFEKHEKRT